MHFHVRKGKLKVYGLQNYALRAIPPTATRRAPPSDAPRVATVLETIYFKFSLI